jgi:hypothetical protein
MSATQTILIRPAQYGVNLDALDLRAAISLSDAAGLGTLKGRKGRPNRQVLARWCKRGKPTRDGAHVLFPAVMSAAGVWITTAEFVERFCREVMRRGRGG